MRHVIIGANSNRCLAPAAKGTVEGHRRGFVMKLFALDLHQDNIVVASMDCPEPEPKIRTKRYLLDQVSLGDFTAMLSKDDLVIMESTMNAFWAYYQIAPHVKSWYVLDTNAVHLRGNYRRSMSQPGRS